MAQHCYWAPSDPRRASQPSAAAAAHALTRSPSRSPLSAPQTPRGWEQAVGAGEKLKGLMGADGKPYRLFFYTSPYHRSKQVRRLRRAAAFAAGGRVVGVGELGAMVVAPYHKFA